MFAPLPLNAPEKVVASITVPLNVPETVTEKSERPVIQFPSSAPIASCLSSVKLGASRLYPMTTLLLPVKPVPVK